jgi:hypothetical protein
VDMDAVAVLAHGLLGTVGSLVGAADRLSEDWPNLDERERAMLLQAVHEHACWIGDVLQDLVRGLPRDVIAALDHQTRVPH